MLGYTASNGNYIPFDIEILVPDASGKSLLLYLSRQSTLGLILLLGSIIQQAGWW